MLLRILFIMFALSLPAASFAGDGRDMEAEKFISDIGVQVSQIARNSSLNVKEQEAQLIDALERHFDTAFMARYALGRYGKRISKQQQEEYLKLYREYMIMKYLPKLRKYAADGFTVTGSRNVKKYVLVDSVVPMVEGKPDVKVTYRLLRGKDGKYRFVDISGEGISLLSTQRSDFSALIAKKGFDHFMELLSQKVAEMRKVA